MQFTNAPYHPVQAVSIVCRNADKFLLVKRSKPTYRNWLAFPGGRIEIGETPLHAANRELYEETNLTASNFTHLITLNLTQNSNYKNKFYLSVYQANQYRGLAKAGDDASETFWLSVKEMQDYKVIPSVVNVACHIIENEI